MVARVDGGIQSAGRSSGGSFGTVGKSRSSGGSFDPFNAIAGAAGNAAGTIKNVAPQPVPAPVAPKASTFIGGGGGGIAAPVASAALAAPAMSEEDYLASGADSAYTAQMAALQKALENQQADITAQQGKYNVDYGDSLKNLGWIQDDPTTPDVNEGAWNFKDTATAAGRGFQNQQNDFAGRGLLQSSLYGEANDNLTRSLNDQLGGINTGKQNFMDDLTRQQNAFTADNGLSMQQAKAEAIARRASQAQAV